MSYSDDYNGGTPGDPLAGSSSLSTYEIAYTAAGRDGTVGLQDAGVSDGSGGYFAYTEETDTMVAQIDFIYTSGDGTFPSSGAIGGATVISFYGVSPTDGPFSDIFGYNISVDSGGAYHEVYDYVTGLYSVYPLTGGGWTSDYFDAGRSRPAFDAWRTARCTLADGTFTFDLLATDGTTNLFSYSMDMTGWLVTACLCSVGWNASHNRRVNIDNFSYLTTPVVVPLTPYEHAGWNIGATTRRRVTG